MSLGRALDEYKAYRQIPIAEDQRNLSVVALVNPNEDANGATRPRTEYVIMNGHCFGFVNAVYNYCRRPLAMRHNLLKIFWVVTQDYVDDRWAVEPLYSIESSFRTTSAIFKLLGIPTAESKAQGPPELIGDSGRKPWQEPELLGVILDLERREVRITEDRKRKIQTELREILADDRLTPGQASKLKGKLGFASSTVFGRTGRAFMRSLSCLLYTSPSPRD